MIDQDWPFLHLNLISPSQPSPSIGGTFDPINLQNSLSNQHQILDSNNSQEISPLTFDPTQLEVWSNINFNFEELPSKATFDQPFNSNNSNSHSELLPESCNSLDEQKLILSSPVSNNSDLNRNRFLGHSNEALIFDSSSSSASNSNNNLKNILPIQNSELTSRNLFNDHSQAEYQQRSRSNTLTNQKQTRTVSSNLNNNKNLTKNQSADEFNRLNHNSDESPVAEDEELNRVSQEDEKRRRNTLASARFRMKKKMKEQEIERTAKEMKERVSELEKEVEVLKQQNDWLRGLILDQSNSRSNAKNLVGSTVTSDTEKFGNRKKDHSFGDGEIEETTAVHSKRKRLNHITKSVNIPSN